MSSWCYTAVHRQTWCSRSRWEFSILAGNRKWPEMLGVAWAYVRPQHLPLQWHSSSHQATSASTKPYLIIVSLPIGAILFQTTTMLNSQVSSFLQFLLTYFFFLHIFASFFFYLYTSWQHDWKVPLNLFRKEGEIQRKIRNLKWKISRWYVERKSAFYLYFPLRMIIYSHDFENIIAYLCTFDKWFYVYLKVTANIKLEGEYPFHSH